MGLGECAYGLPNVGVEKDRILIFLVAPSGICCCGSVDDVLRCLKRGLVAHALLVGGLVVVLREVLELVEVVASHCSYQCKKDYHTTKATAGKRISKFAGPKSI